MAWKLCFALSSYAVRLFLLHGALGDTDAAYYNEDQLGRKMIFTWYYHTFAILLCLACTLGTFFFKHQTQKNMETDSLKGDKWLWLSQGKWLKQIRKQTKIPLAKSMQYRSFSVQHPFIASIMTQWHTLSSCCVQQQIKATFSIKLSLNRFNSLFFLSSHRHVSACSIVRAFVPLREICLVVFYMIFCSLQ